MNGKNMITHKPLWLALLWLLLAGSNAWAQGFAGLGSDADQFAKVVPGHPITFPADFGPHTDYRIEWWYVTANLTAEDGQEMGVQWTLFRQARKPGPLPDGWSSHEFWMGHAALTTASGHHFAEKLGRGGTGQAGATATPFEAWIDDWRFAKTDGKPEPEGGYSLNASGDDFGYNLILTAHQPPVLNGDGGFSRKSEDGHASYYFSIPSFTVTGSVSVDGKDYTVSGNAWLDREWSSQPLSGTQEGWDWFSLRLDSGETVMLFQLRDREKPPFLSGTWTDRAGNPASLERTEISLTPLETVRVAGRQVPVRWAIDIPSRSLKIETTALWPQSWMGTSVAYWEGPVSATGSHTAKGYLEMTGY